MSGLLNVTNARFGYSDLTVVWDVSLEVSPGRACVLVGRNGAGKTTLLSGIAGMLACEHGTITLGDTRIDRMPVHQRVRHGLAFVQEGKRVLRDLSVRENLLLGTFGTRMSRSEQRQSLAEMCDRFPHLARRLASPAGSLSGGQQQMLAIAQGLISRPRVLLLDEPSSGLAPVIVEEVMAMIARLRQEGLGILLVEEHVDEVLSGIADDIVMLEQGRVVLSAAASELRQEDLVRGMRLSGAGVQGIQAAETWPR